MARSKALPLLQRAATLAVRSVEAAGSWRPGVDGARACAAAAPSPTAGAARLPVPAHWQKYHVFARQQHAGQSAEQQASPSPASGRTEASGGGGGSDGPFQLHRRHQRAHLHTLLSREGVWHARSSLAVPAATPCAAAAAQQRLLSSAPDNNRHSHDSTPSKQPPHAAAATSTPSSTSGTAPIPRPAGAHPIYNLPNAVSAARLASGPIIGVWLLNGHYEAATIALAISGASDWLDGYLARRTNSGSVFGSYLDPLADKVLIGCVAAALLANGAMPVWLAVVVVGRDVLLVTGSFAFRLRGFGWRWPGAAAFFRTADVAAPAAPPPPPGPAGAKADAEAGGSADAGASVAVMKPLLISKANTVLQLVLLGGYLLRGMYGWPDGEPVAALELATAATTVASMVAYGSMAVQGRLFK